MTSTIAVTIAGKAERAAARRKSARVLTFEDGLARHITLTGKQWQNFDAILAEGWTEQQLLWVAFDTAREAHANGTAPDFEEELRQCVRQAVTHVWTRTAEGQRQRPSNWSGEPAA